MTADEIIRAILSDRQLLKIKDKIQSGKGTFEDTAKYSNRASELLGKYFSESVLDISEQERVEACTKLLNDRYDDINTLLDATQRSIDSKSNLQIKPQHAGFDIDRAVQIGESLIDKTVPDSTIVRRAGSAPVTMSRSMHDDYIKANAEFRSRAGLKCYITRVSDNEPCKWCTRLAGRYEYGQEPDDVYRRHDNCGCTVTYESGRERQNVWTKNKWTVPDKEAGAEPPKVFTREEAQRLNDAHGSGFVNKMSIDNSVKSGIIKSRSIASRNLPNGLRTAPSHILTETEIESLKKDIASIEADESVFKFNKGHRTGYDDVLDEIRVKGDILPDFSSKHPRDRMSSRAALAHEYYGHRANRGTNVPNGAWNDEFRASYMAAKNCPNLSDEERADLILDALERAKENGVTIKNNDFIRRILYGY